MFNFKQSLTYLRSSRFQQIAFAVIAFFLAALVLWIPFSKVSGIEDIGALLIWAAILVFIQGFRRSSVQEKNSAHISALFTLFLGLLMINAGLFTGDAVYIFAILLFAADALRQLFASLRA